MTHTTRKKINPLGLKSSHIRSAMAHRWTAPEWAIMWEVGEGTGSHSGRYADAVMMSLWPSRGLELHGVEIKVSRSDWKREAADPRKAEAVGQYCDRWWVHTPEGVVDDLSDMPPAWGLREWTGKQWRTLKEAEKTEVNPIPRSFLAAMLRRADDTMAAMIRQAQEDARAAANAETEKQRLQFAERVKRAVEDRTRNLSYLEEKCVEFEKAFGDDVVKGFGVDFARLGRSARAIQDCSGWGDLSNFEAKFREAADAIARIREITEASQ